MKNKIEFVKRMSIKKLQKFLNGVSKLMRMNSNPALLDRTLFHFIVKFKKRINKRNIKGGFRKNIKPELVRSMLKKLMQLLKQEDQKAKRLQLFNKIMLLAYKKQLKIKKRRKKRE